MADENELLIEQVTSAYRERGTEGEVRPHWAFFDLPPQERRRAFYETVLLRQLESAMDEKGLSTTAKAVLARIHRAR